MKAKEARRLLTGIQGRLRTRPVRMQMRLTCGESELLDAVGDQLGAKRTETLVTLLRREGKRLGLPVPQADTDLRNAVEHASVATTLPPRW